MAEPVRKQKKKTVRRRRPGLLSVVAVLAMFVCLGLFVLALVQIDLLGHDFFIYTDRDSGEVHVLYRRSDGGYGLLTQKEY